MEISFIDRTPNVSVAQLGITSDNKVETLTLKFINKSIGGDDLSLFTPYLSVVTKDKIYADKLDLEKKLDGDYIYYSIELEESLTKYEFLKAQVVCEYAGKVWHSDMFSLAFGNAIRVDDLMAEIYPQVLRNILEMLASKVGIEVLESEIERVEKEILDKTQGIPKQTSQLTNDGADGEHPFITAEDVKNVGGKIDKILVNGDEQEIKDKAVDISVPTEAGDVGAYNKAQTDNVIDSKIASKIETDIRALIEDLVGDNAGAELTLDVDDNYVVQAKLLNANGEALSTASIDLPLESVVVSGKYNKDTKEVELTLQNGSQVAFSVADLVSGLQSEITADNKLSADLVVDDDSTHKFVTSTQTAKWDLMIPKSDFTTDYISTGVNIGISVKPTRDNAIAVSYSRINYDATTGTKNTTTQVADIFFVGKGLVRTISTAFNLSQTISVDTDTVAMKEDISKMLTTDGGQTISGKETFSAEAQLLGGAYIPWESGITSTTYRGWGALQGYILKCLPAENNNGCILELGAGHTRSKVVVNNRLDSKGMVAVTPTDSTILATLNDDATTEYVVSLKDSTTYEFGNLGKETKLIGNGARPKYETSTTVDGGVELALLSDVPTTTDEVFAVTDDLWESLEASSPFLFKTTVFATKTLGDNTEVGIVNDQPLLFATYGFVVGAIDGQSVTIWAVAKPTEAVNLTVRIKE